jgi:hypothetical protein
MEAGFFSFGRATVQSGADRFSVLGSLLTSVGATSAVLNSFNSDTVHAGQGYLTCDILPHVSCATSFISLSMAAFELPPPPTPADVTLTVPGMFNLVMNARVLFADPTRTSLSGSRDRDRPRSRCRGAWGTVAGPSSRGSPNLSRPRSPRPCCSSRPRARGSGWSGGIGAANRASSMPRIGSRRPEMAKRRCESWRPTPSRSTCY